MNIIILGAPASGKGTQAELIAKKYNLYYLQTGALAREIAVKDERIKAIVNSGKLIPEEEMTMYVLDHLKGIQNSYTNILFEGYPRFISQYEALEAFLKTKGDDMDAVISLDVSREVAVKRISARRICGSCGEVYNLMTHPSKNEGVCDKCGGKLVQREDDEPGAINERFIYYENNTKELIDYLDKQGKLIRINGERPVEVIFDEIQTKLSNLF